MVRHGDWKEGDARESTCTAAQWLDVYIFIRTGLGKSAIDMEDAICGWGGSRNSQLVGLS